MYVVATVRIVKSGGVNCEGGYRGGEKCWEFEGESVVGSVVIVM